MCALLTAVALFAFSFFAHVITWRIRRPQAHLRGLIAVFLGSAVAGGALLVVAKDCWHFPTPPVADVPSIALFYLGATFCYLIIYTGIADPSPSLLIIRSLESSPARGRTRAELAVLFTEQRLMDPRLHELKAEQLLAATAAGYFLTRRGFRVARGATTIARIFQIHDGA